MAAATTGIPKDAPKGGHQRQVPLTQILEGPALELEQRRTTGPETGLEDTPLALGWRQGIWEGPPIKGQT